MLVDLGFAQFKVSAGVLPYPITFLITDLLSELYGRKRTNAVVLSGFFATVLVLLILYLGHYFPALSNSPVNDGQFDVVFKNSWRVFSASMIAYLAAQFLDVRLFHFWKGLTKGKHLWLRNNFSTILSQLVDTILVTTVIFIGVEDFNFIGGLVLDGWLFKALVALVDTVLLYALVYFFRKYFSLAPGEELRF